MQAVFMYSKRESSYILPLQLLPRLLLLLFSSFNVSFVHQVYLIGAITEGADPHDSKGEDTFCLTADEKTPISQMNSIKVFLASYYGPAIYVTGVTLFRSSCTLSKTLFMSMLGYILKSVE